MSKLPNRPVQLTLTTDILRQAPLFRVLDEREAQVACAPFRLRQFEKNEMIFQHGDPGGCLYLIGGGRVRIFLPGPEGREVTLRIYERGDIFGELAVLDDGARTASAQAMDNVYAYVLYREEFMQLLSGNFKLVQHVIRMLSERLRYTTTYTERLAFMSMPARIAAALLQLSSGINATEQAGMQAGMQAGVISITQQDLANFVGTTREWVNRTLKDFARRGWIKLARGTIYILNLQALQQVIVV